MCMNVARPGAKIAQSFRAQNYCLSQIRRNISSDPYISNRDERREGREDKSGNRGMEDWKGGKSAGETNINERTGAPRDEKTGMGMMGSSSEKAKERADKDRLEGEKGGNNSYADREQAAREQARGGSSAFGMGSGAATTLNDKKGLSQDKSSWNSSSSSCNSSTLGADMDRSKKNASAVNNAGAFDMGNDKNKKGTGLHDQNCMNSSSFELENDKNKSVGYQGNSSTAFGNDNKKSSGGSSSNFGNASDRMQSSNSGMDNDRGSRQSSNSPRDNDRRQSSNSAMDNDRGSRQGSNSGMANDRGSSQNFSSGMDNDRGSKLNSNSGMDNDRGSRLDSERGSRQTSNSGQSQDKNFGLENETGPQNARKMAGHLQENASSPGFGTPSRHASTCSTSQTIKEKAGEAKEKVAELGKQAAEKVKEKAGDAKDYFDKKKDENKR